MSSGEIATNRRALHDYQIQERFEAGIELRGTEVKSIRSGKINLRDAFARIEKDELFLFGCDIQPYESASHEQHESKRPRKLLLHKREINKLLGLTAQKGLTIVALRAYWKNRRVKIEIGVGRGKSKTDKRETLKKKALDREAQREIARFKKR